MVKPICRTIGRVLVGLGYRLLCFADADAIARARVEHIRVSVQLADFPPSVAAEFIARGVPPQEVARQMADALRVEQ
jgi:hypothetical protein